MSRGRFAILCGVFVLTGATALCLQVVWHRVLALHSGLDLGSATTVVVAFLAGLALGNVAGGRLADRIGPQRSLLALAGFEAGVASFAIVSVQFLVHLPRLLVPDAAGAVAGFAVYAVALLVPTLLMGATIPLAAEVVNGPEQADRRRVGWLYGLNSIGAAAGAIITGWVLLGSFGAFTTARIAAVAGWSAAVVLWILHRTTPAAPERAIPESATPGDPEAASVASRASVGPWVLMYAISGAVAIGLQQVFFRVVDLLMRSNAYTFSLTLGLYLSCFGAGAAAGSRLTRTVRDPRRAFLFAQLWVAIGAALPVIILSKVMPGLGVDGGLSEWLSGSGFRGGVWNPGGGSPASLLIRFALVLPVLVLGPAVVAMGISFPLVERIVTESGTAVGRRTGDLLAANTVGNVAGGLVTTFVLIDLIGTGGTLRVLCGIAAASAIAGLMLLVPTRRTTVAIAGGAAVLIIAALPTNAQLWSALHGGDGHKLHVAEDRTCVSAMKVHPDGRTVLSINGADQNDYPFDDFHVLIGLLPVLAHPDPNEVLAVGLGIGSTSFAALADTRTDRVSTAELCGGNKTLVEQLREGRPEFGALIDDPRHANEVRDGRSVLRAGDGGLDVVVIDTLIPQSASSGNTYSREFYELVDSRLSADGIFAQWVPTGRVVDTAASVFSHIVTVEVPSYDSTFMLASRSPIALDRAELQERFERQAADRFTAEQRRRLENELAQLKVTCIEPTSVPPEDGWNLDLLPRDEFFLNQPVRSTADGIDRLAKECTDA